MQFFRFTAFFLVISLNLQGQGRDYQGPDDPAGDPSAERSGYMTGNRVLIFLKTQQSFLIGLPRMLQNGQTIQKA